MRIGRSVRLTRRTSLVALVMSTILAMGAIAMAQNDAPLDPPKLQGAEPAIAVPGAMFPVMQRLQSGKLAAVVRGGAPHVGVGGLLNLVTSDDGGETWSEPSLIVYMPPDTRDWAFGQAADGRLIMAFAISGAYTNGQHVFEATRYLPWVTTSDDEGAQWTTPKRLDIAPFQHSSLFGKILTLSDGTVLLGGYGWYVPDEEGGELPPEERGMSSYVLRSTDNGQTWGELTIISRVHNETALAELPDGRVLAVMRGAGLSQSFSSDGGRTWSEPEPVLSGARLPADLVLLDSGKLLLTFGRRIEGSFGAEAVLSGDEYGQWDWSTNRMLEWNAPNSDCGYPSSAQLDDGTIVTLYYKVTNDPAAPGLAGHVQVWCLRYQESDLMAAP